VHERAAHLSGSSSAKEKKKSTKIKTNKITLSNAAFAVSGLAAPVKGGARVMDPTARVGTKNQRPGAVR
jgi:hypothetical protein